MIGEGSPHIPQSSVKCVFTQLTIITVNKILNTVKILNICTPKKYTVIILKLDLYGFFIKKCAQTMQMGWQREQSDLGLHSLLRPVSPKI